MQIKEEFSLSASDLSGTSSRAPLATLERRAPESGGHIARQCGGLRDLLRSFTPYLGLFPLPFQATVCN